MSSKFLSLTLILLFFSLPLSAETGTWNSDIDYAQVTKVRMIYRSSDEWDVHVTVRHNDQGWDHYADRWQVLDADTGEVIGERILAHPHDTEQPFTRSLSRLAIPEDVRVLTIRSSCPNHGFGGREITVELPAGDIENGYTIVLE